MFEYIFFDFDGTLADSSDCVIKATQSAFTSINLNPPLSADIIDMMGIPIEVSFLDLGARSVSKDTFDNLLASFRKYYKEFADHELRAFPGAVELLKTLKSDKTIAPKIALVTSKKTDVASSNSQSLGLYSYFDVIIGSDKVMHYKPNPEGIFVALQYFNVETQAALNAIMIGDATFDIQMGQSAGIKTCGVSWGAHSAAKLQMVKPDYLVHNFKDLLDVIKNKA